MHASFAISYVGAIRADGRRRPRASIACIDDGRKSSPPSEIVPDPTAGIAGAYTTARTFNRHSVFEFETHVVRTADSVALMMEADAQNGRNDHAQASAQPPSNDSSALQASASGSTHQQCMHAPIVDPKQLRPLLMAGMRDCITTFEALRSNPATSAAAQTTGVAAGAAAALTAAVSPSSSSAAAASAQAMNAGELKITVLVCWADNARRAIDATAPMLEEDRSVASPAAVSTATRAPSPDLQVPYVIVTHVTSLPQRRQPPIRVQVRGAPRHNARAKDSEWVRQRTSLESSKPADVEEILLCDVASGSVLEGTQTNAYAVINGTVYTADDGILAGTVRRLVLEVCQRERIPVVLEPPSIHGIKKEWDGCFITSTSRLVLPVDEIAWPAAADPADGYVPQRVHAQVENVAHKAADDGEWRPLPKPDHVKRFATPHPLIARIEQLVALAVAGHSTNVLEDGK